MSSPHSFLTATDIAARIRRRELTSRQIVAECLARIEERNPSVNAIVTLAPREALAAAENADRILDAIGPSGPLHGVPVTIKDTYHVAGLNTTAGYAPLREHMASRDAVPVRLLKEAGAIVLGKTNTATLAMDMQAANPIFGRTNNPWNLALTPGGSSGGCAAALASGLTPLSLGSDLAGSIRLPASYCGVYGFKPTHGVISMEGHVPPLPGHVNGVRSMAVVGPLARSAEDLALALRVLTAPNRHDRCVAPLPEPPNAALSAAGLRIAWTDGFGGVPVAAEIREAMAGFIAKLSAAGATVVRCEPKGLDYEEVWELWGRLVATQANLEMPNFLRQLGDWISRRTVRRIPMHRRIVGPISVRGLMQALEVQSRYITLLDNFLTEYDAWICPVSATCAFPHHAPTGHFGDFLIYNQPMNVDGQPLGYYIATQAYTTVFATTNSPVVSMPIGVSGSGLPVNVQIVGRRHSDHRLLQIAASLSALVGRISYPFERSSQTAHEA